MAIKTECKGNIDREKNHTFLQSKNETSTFLLITFNTILIIPIYHAKHQLFNKFLSIKKKKKQISKKENSLPWIFGMNTH